MTHLVWDWNGTLLDDLALTITATNASLSAVGGPAVSADRHRRIFCRPLVDYYGLVLGRGIQAGEFELIDEVFHRTYRSGLDTCQLTADAVEAMLLWSRTSTQSILSMWTHQELIRELDRRGLSRWLLRADGRTGYGLGDRKAGYLAGHLAALDLTGPECVLIGDSVDDADAAAEVGAACVLFSGGITHADVLRARGCPVASTLVEAVTIASGLEPPAPSGAGTRRVEDRAS